MFMLYASLVISFFCLNGKLTSGLECNKGNAMVEEGILEYNPFFSWLGLLKVHLHEITSIRIAVTGLVLIKDNYAIANANDIAKIPKFLLKNHSMVMFIYDYDNPWHCKVKDYMTHPEYKILTYNTIALVELYLIDENDVLPKSICWPLKYQDPGHDLYVIGYKYENGAIAKSIHKVQHIEKSDCDEFYVRANLSDDMLIPMRYQCAYAMNIRESCVWDNGMVIASNSTGYWVLLGITVQGPGCAAPVRYIDIGTYLTWISASINGKNGRKAAFKEGFTPQVVDNIPIHTLFQEGKVLRKGGEEDFDIAAEGFGAPGTEEPDHRGSPFFSSFYPPSYANTFISPNTKWKMLETYYNESEQYSEYSLNGDDCKNKSNLAYKETSVIKDSSIYDGEGIYYLTVNDGDFEELNCIKLFINSDSAHAKGWAEFQTYVMHTGQPDSTIRKIYKNLKITPTTTESVEILPRFLRQSENVTVEREKIDLSHFISSLYVTPVPMRLLNTTINLLAVIKFHKNAEIRVEVHGIRRKHLDEILDKKETSPKPKPASGNDSESNSEQPELWPWRRFRENKRKPKVVNEIEAAFWSGESFIVVDKTVERKMVVKNERQNEIDRKYPRIYLKALKDRIRPRISKYEDKVEYLNNILGEDDETTTEFNDFQIDQTTEIVSTSYNNTLQYKMPSSSLSRCPICKTMLLCFVVFLLY